jgi:hypothetical protein
MASRTPGYALIIPGRTARIAAVFAAALAAGASNAQDLPALRAGLWEVQRTVEAPGDAAPPRTLQSRDCMSPTEDMRKQQRMLESIGCKFSPVAQAGNTYTFSADCGQEAAGSSKSTLTVEGDTAYSIRIESVIDGSPSQELLRATRVGDCPP